MTQDELIHLVRDLRGVVNQQSAQIAAMGALLSTFQIEQSAFTKARKHLGDWNTAFLHGEAGFPRAFTPSTDAVTYLNRIEEAITGKPVE
jgi:hypothetical protein